MARHIFNEDEYEHGSKWFARWHRDHPENNATMIDLDGVGYCQACLQPLYLIEATRATKRKNASVTERLGELLGATVWVVYQDKAGGHPGEILLDDRTAGINHGWLSEERVWGMLSAVRSGHACAGSEFGAA